MVNSMNTCSRKILKNNCKSKRAHGIPKTMRVGTPLPIVDKNGTQIRIGDTVNFTYHCINGKTYNIICIVVYDTVYKTVFLANTESYQDDNLGIYDIRRYYDTFPLRLDNGMKPLLEIINVNNRKENEYETE